MVVTGFKAWRNPSSRLVGCCHAALVAEGLINDSSGLVTLSALEEPREHATSVGSVGRMPLLRSARDRPCDAS